MALGTTTTVTLLNSLRFYFYFFLYFLLLNSVYTVLPLSQGLDRVKGGTIHMETVKYAQNCA